HRGRSRTLTIGRPLIGSIRRTKAMGLKLRPRVRKRGQKSVILSELPCASVRVVSTMAVLRTYRRVAWVISRKSTANTPLTEPPPSRRSNAQNTGSASGLGRHIHTIRPRQSINAATWQLPMTARSKSETVLIRRLNHAVRRCPATNGARRRSRRRDIVPGRDRRPRSRPPPGLRPAESPLVGEVVADEYRSPARERRLVHIFLDGGSLVEPARHYLQ